MLVEDAEELAVAVDRVAEEILDQAELQGPPVDAFVVARRLGMTVALDAAQQGRARYVRLGGRQPRSGRPTILLRPDVRAEREQWSVAHEIGEHAAARVVESCGLDPCELSPYAREEIANRLANCLLLPIGWFEADGHNMHWDLTALKTRYATASHELIARRMLDCRPPVVIAIFDQGTISFRRSNLPGSCPPLSAMERECWQQVHETNRPHEIATAQHSIQGWPVHEANWKREILRREIESWPTDEF